MIRCDKKHFLLDFVQSRNIQYKITYCHKKENEEKVSNENRIGKDINEADFVWIVLKE